MVKAYDFYFLQRFQLQRPLRAFTIISIASLFSLMLYTLPCSPFYALRINLINSKTNFIPSLNCSNINQIQIEQGRKHLSENRVIICGLIRDREFHIKRLKQQLSKISQLFADYAIVIVENDSKDGTRRELVNWAHSDNHIHVIGCGNEVNSIVSCNLSLAATNRKSHSRKSRIEKMAMLRNLYMNYIESHSLLKQYEYVIIEDFDLITYTDINGIYSTGFYLKHDSTIDAICSNGIFYHKLAGNMITYETYFDPYAHRDNQNQYWSKTFNDNWSTFYRRYSCNDGLISVQSCFSGRTIYRYKSIEGKRYQTYEDQYQEPVCEHVGFHENITKIYLNSEMVFYVTENSI